MGLTLANFWDETVRAAPSAVALIDAETRRTWTRAELSVEIDRWVNRFRDRDLARARIVFAEPNGMAWWAAFLGCVRCGAVPIALDATDSVEGHAAAARAIAASGWYREGQLHGLQGGRKAAREVCLYKLTSGSTGRPRALPFTTAQMVGDGQQICRSMEIRAADVNLAVIPFGHSYGLGNLVLPLALQGTAVVCAASPLPQALAADCATWQPTVFPAVPTLLRALARADIPPAALHSLRLVISAGAPLPADVATAFETKFQRAVHGFYGTSETGGITFDRGGEATRLGRSVGTPLDGVTLSFGRAGRFTVASSAVGRRGTFSPADRGRLNASGELELLGRAGRTVKIAARRVDLGDIERALRSVDGVRDAYAMAHPQRPDALAAAVWSDRPAADIRRELRARVPAWKVPERLVVCAEFPTTVRGKPNPRALRALLARGA